MTYQQLCKPETNDELKITEIKRSTGILHTLNIYVKQQQQQ